MIMMMMMNGEVVVVVVGGGLNLYHALGFKTAMIIYIPIIPNSTPSTT